MPTTTRRTREIRDRENGGTREVSEGPPLKGQPTLAAMVADLFRACDNVDKMPAGRVQQMRMGVVAERVESFCRSYPIEEQREAIAAALKML